MVITDKTYRIIEKGIAVLAAFLAVEGFQLLYLIRGSSTMFANSVFSTLVFAAFLFLGFHIVSREFDRRTLLFGLAGGFLASVLTCMGLSVHYLDTIWTKNTFLAMFFLTPFFGGCMSLVLTSMKEGRSLQSAEEKPGQRWFLLCWLLLFLSWMPVLLASWPGIFSYDSGTQLVSYVDGQVSGHHPILHTYLLGICRRAGLALLGSRNAGAVLYCLIQMAAMSGMYAYVCRYLKKKQAPRWLQIGTFVFLAFHPINGLMAVCATKDSIFTALFAVFMIQLLEMAEHREGFFSSVRRQGYFCLSVFALFAFRNNGFHTFLLSIPFFLWTFKKYWKRMGILILICLGLYGLYTGPVYKILGVEKGNPREMCCVLMQSAARVYNMDNLGLTEEEKEIFLSIIREEGMQSYLSWFADPVKAHFNGNKFFENPGPFLKAWFQVGMRHKKLYIDSFLANTYGYWYPGNSDHGRDYVEYFCSEVREDVDVVMAPKLPALSEFYRKLSQEYSFKNVPVISASFNLGAYTWLLLFAFLLLLYRRQYGEMILVIPLFMYLVTTMLGPIVTMRYHYPVIACGPLILFLIWRGKGEWIK